MRLIRGRFRKSLGRTSFHKRLDRLHLGEEAVAANVVAIALVDLGARDAADLVAFLEDDRMVRVAVLVKLIGGGQAGRSAADDRYCGHIFLDAPND